MILRAGEWGTAGSSQGVWGEGALGGCRGAFPPPLGLSGEEREMRPRPSVLKEKALGSVSSCPTLSTEEVGSLSPRFQGLRSCSLLSLWKKLLPNS